jgi:hypothetical protein
MVGQFIPVYIFETIVGRIVPNCKSRLQAIPSKLAAILPNCTEDEILSRLREEFAEVLEESLPFDVKQYQGQCKAFVLSLDEEEKVEPKSEGKGDAE